MLISRVASGGHTEPSDVMESNLTVQGIECVSGINQEHGFGVTGVKGGSHGGTAASMPDISSPNIWTQPEASWMSGFITDSTTLAKICRCAVSPMPIGRTPGFLSRALSRQARRGDKDFGSTYDVHTHMRHKLFLQAGLRSGIVRLMYTVSSTHVCLYQMVQQTL